MADEFTTELVEEHIDTQLCGALVNTDGALVPVQEIFTINGTQIINKAVNLANIPVSGISTRVFRYGAVPQIPTIDYVVIGSSINWNGLELDGIIAAGDTMVIQYYMA